MNLFIAQPTLELEKTASSYPLVGRPENWESEFLAAIHKQAPYLGQYRLDLSISQENREAGYLLGYFIVSPHAGIPSSMTAPPVPNPVDAEQAQMSGEAPGVRIPVVVTRSNSSSVLKPFDIMLDKDGKAQPLTEERLAAIMSATSGYEASPSPTGVENKLIPEPPTGQGTGQGTGVTMTMDKTSSLLDEVLVTVTKDEIDTFRSSLNSPDVLHAIETNDAFREGVRKILYAEPAAVTKVAGLGLKPTVLLVEKVAGGYDLTTANRFAFAPVTTHIPNEKASTLPMHLLRDAAEHGMVMHSDIDNKRDEALVKEASELGTGETREQGQYLVPHQGGASVCQVFPKVHDLELGRSAEVLVVKLASADGFYDVAVQGSVPYLGDGQVTQTRQPPAAAKSSISNCKVAFVSPDGTQATAPVTVKHQVFKGDTTQYRTDTGIVLEKSAGLSAPLPYKGTVYIPDDWYPVRVREELRPVSAGLHKEAALANNHRGGVVVKNFGGERYTFEGPFTESLATEDVTDVTKKAALVLLGAAGVPLYEGLEVLKEAKACGRASRSTPRKVTSYGTAKSKAQTKVASLQAKIRKLSLVKEAAALTSPQSVDSVLALNFVSPDNLSTFLEKRPDLEASLRTLCDLLLLARLGLEDVKEASVERAVKGLTEVMTGLDEAEMRMQAQ